MGPIEINLTQNGITQQFIKTKSNIVLLPLLASVPTMWQFFKAFIWLIQGVTYREKENNARRFYTREVPNGQACRFFRWQLRSAN